MNTFSAFIAAAAFSLNSLSIRVFQLKCQKNPVDIRLFQTLFCLVAALAYSVSCKFIFTLTLVNFISAAAFGALFAICILFSSVCFECGPMSVTSVIVNSSIIVPVLFSFIFLKEAINPTHIAGIILLIATFIILSGGSKDKKAVSARWLILVLISFFANGATAVIQKMYKLSAGNSNGYDFMAAAYAVAAAVILAAYFAGKHKENRKETMKARPLGALLVLTAGLGSFAGNGLLMTLCTKMPASALYPIVNGGLCVIVSAVSLLLFREKVTAKKITAILCGLAAIIVLNL